MSLEVEYALVEKVPVAVVTDVIVSNGEVVDVSVISSVVVGSLVDEVKFIAVEIFVVTSLVDDKIVDVDCGIVTVGVVVAAGEVEDKIFVVTVLLLIVVVVSSVVVTVRKNK